MLLPLQHVHHECARVHEVTSNNFLMELPNDVQCIGPAVGGRVRRHAVRNLGRLDESRNDRLLLVRLALSALVLLSASKLYWVH